MSNNRRWSPCKSAWCPIIQTDQRSDEDKHSISGHPKFRPSGSSGFRGQSLVHSSSISVGIYWTWGDYSSGGGKSAPVIPYFEPLNPRLGGELRLGGSSSIGVLLVSKNSNVSCPLILTLSLSTWSCSISLYRSEFLLHKEYSSRIL